MRNIPYGWLQAEIIYQCRWCERRETIVFFRDDENVYNPPPELDGWRPCCGPTLDLCSSDCQKERDEASLKAVAACPPRPQDRYYANLPEGYDERLEEFRQEALRLRRQAHDGRV